LKQNINIGIVLINIDRFTAVNDEHGDNFGDQLLQLYAQIIKANVRHSDIVVRFSGGEFLVLLINIDTQNRIIQIAQKLQEKLHQSYLLTSCNDKFRKTVTIGTSIFPQDSNDMQQVINNSKVALQIAQQKGRGSIAKYEKPTKDCFELF